MDFGDLFLATPIIALTTAITLSFVLISAAWHKFYAGIRFEAQLAEYDLLPPQAVPLVRKLLTAGEAAVAVALVFPQTWDWSGPMAALLLGVYLGAIAINLLRGRTTIDCGCGDAPQPLSWWLVVRNAVLILCAVLISQASTALTAMDLIYGLVASIATILVYLAAEQLIRNASAIHQWRTAHD